MKKSEFRAELVKIMPGYNWTVRASRSSKLLVATGIQSSGSNRISTLHVERRDNYGSSGKPLYEVKSAGYGRRAPWLHTAEDITLARALRALQDHYERTASTYCGHAEALKVGRKAQDAAPAKGERALSETWARHEWPAAPITCEQVQEKMTGGGCPTAGSLGECAAMWHSGNRWTAALYIWDANFNDSTAVAKWFRELGAVDVSIVHTLYDTSNGDRNGEVPEGGARQWLVEFSTKEVANA